MVSCTLPQGRQGMATPGQVQGAPGRDAGRFVRSLEFLGLILEKSAVGRVEARFLFVWHYRTRLRVERDKIQIAQYYTQRHP